MKTDSHPKDMTRASALVEISIVAIVIGALASIFTPSFSSAGTPMRQGALHDELRFLRTQVSVFRAQHHDVSPGFPKGDANAPPTEADFMAQMTSFSDEFCGCGPAPTATRVFGPYLRELPKNPVNGKSRVRIVAGPSMPEPDDSQPFGWIYNPALQKLIANSSGADGAGQTYRSY